MAEKAVKIDPLSSPEGSSTPTGRLAQQLQDCELLQGKRFTVTLTNGISTQYVSHPLNRAYKGAYVVGQSDVSAVLMVLRGPSFPTTHSPERVVALKWSAAPSSSTVTVDLWIF